ncbi:hypothetical protein Y032_0272g955 [Ancylostoma ceylanicum]|uniref:Uncharacterized protein n=1 Tax=Ancylostoma ceylanicum TaxID=53326 RepID=A0A016S8A7_9BILA|nr:hypothetical protein Y032_0272g955 [Ancylostoma ceylanicum]
MEQQFDRKHGVVKRKFEIGDKVYAKQRKPPQFHWVREIEVRRVGSVDYEVELGRRMVRKHANQLHLCQEKGNKEGSDTLKVSLEVFALEDAYKRRSLAILSSLEIARFPIG